MVQPISAPTPLLGNGYGNGNGIELSGHTDGTEVLEVFENPSPSVWHVLTVVALRTSAKILKAWISPILLGGT